MESVQRWRNGLLAGAIVLLAGCASRHQEPASTATPQKEGISALPTQPNPASSTTKYSEFLHAWVNGIKAVYRPPLDEAFCGLIVEVVYVNGHITSINQVSDCSPTLLAAFTKAIETATRPAMPTDFANQRVVIRFFKMAACDPHNTCPDSTQHLEARAL